MAYPIWKDYYVNLGVGDSVEYRVRIDGNVIYAGKAYKRPGQSSNQIRINDICADYLHHSLPDLGHLTFSEGEQGKTFDVLALVGDTWTIVDSVQFIADYSYEDSVSRTLSHPINGHLSPLQYLLFTTMDVASVNVVIIKKDGSVINAAIPVAQGVSVADAGDVLGDFSLDFNVDFFNAEADIEVTGSGIVTAVIDMSQYQDVQRVVVNGVVYEVADGCSRYALYYVNAFGGWDSLLVEGNHSEVDNLTRHTREVDYDNRDVRNRGRQNYVNQISKALTLHTSWMSDEESSRMHHLLNSTEVYLYDIAGRRMIPVMLNNTTSEYKTYKSNGCRLVNYAIEVSYANDRIRR